MSNQKNEQNVTAEEINVSVEGTNAELEVKTMTSAYEATEEMKENENTEESTENTDDFPVDLDSFEDVSEKDTYSDYEDNVVDDENYEDEDDFAEAEGSEKNAYDIPDSVPTIAKILKGKKAAKVIEERMDSDDIFTRTEKIKWDELHRCKNSVRIMKARVVKTVSDGNTVAAYCIIDGFEEFPMLVPYEYLDISYRLREVNIKDEKIRVVNFLIGAKINIAIERLFPSSRQGIANRALANFILRRKFYYRGFYKKDQSNKKTIVTAGSIIKDAQIIGVYNRAIRVEAFGALIRIPVEELTHEIITNCHQKFHIGEQIAIKIIDIQYVNDDNCNLKISASVKALLPNKCAIALDNARPGEYSLATVVKFTYDENLIICRSSSGYNCIARTVRTYIKRLRPGSIVKTKFLRKNHKGDYGIVDIVDLIQL